jgi:hypothetical protein
MKAMTMFLTSVNYQQAPTRTSNLLISNLDIVDSKDVFYMAVDVQYSDYILIPETYSYVWLFEQKQRAFSNFIILTHITRDIIILTPSSRTAFHIPSIVMRVACSDMDTLLPNTRIVSHSMRKNVFLNKKDTSDFLLLEDYL